MFEIGENIVYGTTGVCRVADVGTMNLSGASKDRLYYTLIPAGEKDGRIYTPVDNEKVVMRPVLTKEEAENLISEIAEIENIWVADEKRRELIYKEELHKCDCRAWVKIIKTLYLRKQSRLAAGKKVTAVDEKYLRIAETNLYGELALALGMKADEVEAYITRRVTEQKAAEQECE